MNPEDVMVVFDNASYSIYSVHANKLMADREKEKLGAFGLKDYAVMTLPESINWISFKKYNTHD